MGIVERLRKLKWMLNCEVRGMIPDTTAYEAADLIERLKRYAEHHWGCPSYGSEGAECLCGLTALIKEIEGE